MSKPGLLDIKDYLSSALNSTDNTEREQLLLQALDLMSEIEQNFGKVERALRAEEAGDQERANAYIEEALEDLDNEEYSPHDEQDHMHHDPDFPDDTIENTLLRSQAADLDEEE